MLPGAACRFTASYDRGTKIVSAAVCLGMLLLGVLIHNALVGGLALLVLGVSYAYSPRGYVVSKDSVAVQRLIGTVHVPLKNVREARRTRADDFAGCVRLWGSGGLFGYYGLFRTAPLGKCTWYVTDRRNSVVVSTAAETILFSPDDVDGFLQTIGAPASAAAPLPAGTFRQPPGLRWIQRVFWGVVIASLIPVPVILLYSPGAPGYTLTPNQLSIHDRFFPVTLAADAIDVGQIRLVDLAQDRDWRPVRRTRGFANRRYQSGWFQLASGATARVYRAGGNRMVLLPPRGAGVFVLYQAKDPDAFVMELRREWSGR